MQIGAHLRSSSSRRTWIEIRLRHLPWHFHNVVLLAEDVDRNLQNMDAEYTLVCVVLLAEDVDRNVSLCVVNNTGYSRPPRGGRG